MIGDRPVGLSAYTVFFTACQDIFSGFPVAPPGDFPGAKLHIGEIIAENPLPLPQYERRVAAPCRGRGCAPSRRETAFADAEDVARQQRARLHPEEGVDDGIARS